MRLVGAIFAIVLLAPAALAQNESPQKTQPQYKPEQLCTVEGAVVQSTNGEPAKKVVVTLTDFVVHGQMSQHSAMADANGHFIFQGVAPGKYTMQAGGGSYPFQVYSQGERENRPKIITLEPGQHLKDILFKLAPGAVITGTVYDDDGDPVIGANVQAFQTRHGPTGGARTDDRGEYRIFALEPGKYRLAVELPNRNVATNGVYLLTFYPGTTDPAQASPLQVQPGDELSAINLIMNKVPCQKVHGRVIIAGAARLRGTYVALAAPADQDFPPGRDYGAQVEDDNGEFVIQGVPQGSYIALARSNDHQRMYVGNTPVEVGNVDVEGVVVVLKPSFELRGRVRTESGAVLDFARLRVWLQSSDSQIGGGTGAEVKSDGTFMFRNVFDGNYRVRVGDYPEEFYVKAARLGDQDVLADGVALTSSQAGSSLEIILSANGGTISGTVLQNSEPVPGAMVTLVPDPPSRSHEELYSSKRADAFGRFTMLGLPPGDFKIFAWDSVMNADPQDPDFQKTYKDKGQSVRVEERRQQNVQLELIAPPEDQQ